MMKLTATLTALCMSPLALADTDLPLQPTTQAQPMQQLQAQQAVPQQPQYQYPPQQYQYPPQGYPQYAQPYPPRYQPNYYGPQYHLEDRPLIGLAIAGGSVFGAVYTFTAIGGYAGNAWEFAVPVIGPLLYSGRHLDQNDGADRVATAFLALDTIAQAAGVAMLITGLVCKHKVRVAGPPRITFIPSSIDHAPALGAFGTF